MKTRLVELAAHRELLIARAQEQRGALVRQTAVWRRPAETVEKGIAVVTYLKTHPQTVALAAVVVAALWPRRAIKLAWRGLFAWRFVRTFARLRAFVA